MNEPWAEELRQLNPTAFPNGGNRWCVPLRAGEQSLGALVLADRVNGADYTVEELELLQCIADQVTSVLLNLRLANEVARARELEAFRTMSAFFVHDLKNAAASLNLMLKNLPVHFDDPAFREDALRGIGNTARRIDEMIAPVERPAAAARLQARGSRPESARERGPRQAGRHAGRGADEGAAAAARVLADREQIQSVVTNLLLNARDAVGAGRPHSGPHGAPGRPRRAVGRGQWLRDERGVPEGLPVPPLPEHQEEGARHRHVPVPDDRRGARGQHPGGERAGQGHARFG